MTYRGHVKNGVVVLDEEAPLTEGLLVNVVPIQAVHGKSLAERFKDIIGIVNDLPSDMARNHDHYIHGTPKR